MGQTASLKAELEQGRLTRSFQNDICSKTRDIQERFLECSLHVCAEGRAGRRDLIHILLIKFLY